MTTAAGCGLLTVGPFLWSWTKFNRCLKVSPMSSARSGSGCTPHPLRPQDSNPDKRFQRPLCCHYTRADHPDDCIGASEKSHPKVGKPSESQAEDVWAGISLFTGSEALSFERNDMLKVRPQRAAFASGRGQAPPGSAFPSTMREMAGIWRSRRARASTR